MYLMYFTYRSWFLNSKLLPFANTLCNAGEGHYEVNTLRTAPTSDAGKSILRAIGRGGPRKSRLLRALKWQQLHPPPLFPTHTNNLHRCNNTHVPKITCFLYDTWTFDFDGGKSINRAIGWGGPSQWICPHQHHYVPRHINNRYILVILCQLL
jgi:hypothetical protein